VEQVNDWGEGMKKLFFALLFVLVVFSLAYASVPIYCPHCKTHLYDYQKDKILPYDKINMEDFCPVRKSCLIICSECGEKLYELISDSGIMSVGIFEPFDNVPSPIKGEKAVCPFCGTDIVQEVRRAHYNFIFNEKVIKPDENSKMVCPFDGCPLNLYLSWAWEKKVAPPRFMVPAVSMLTKDKDGNWVGVPYDVKYEDWEGKH
jgi:hypothetical protein